MGYGLWVMGSEEEDDEEGAPDGGPPVAAEELLESGNLYNPRWIREHIGVSASDEALINEVYDFLNNYPQELSGGMRQKAALIRTLATNPQLLLLDEPFSALDYQTRINISSEVKNIIKSESKTAILVSHDIAEAINLSDRILIFSKRPSHIKKTIEIDKKFKALPHLQKRNNPLFNEYFDTIWSELNA